MPARTPEPYRARGSGAAHDGGGSSRQGRSGPARRIDLPPDSRFRSRGERNFELPKVVADELGRKAAVISTRARRSPVTLERRMASAAMAYERDRYHDALSALKPVLEAAPQSGSVRELHGLVLYRLGRWRAAAKELRVFYSLSGSYDQHPVIADCERALGHPDKVRSIWDEIRRAGVDREVLVEGRLVMAGTLADAGCFAEAIELLRPEARLRRNPDISHLRQWYALADLYERTGDLSRARELFARVAEVAPDLLDAPQRLAALS
ncbi:MAG: tetratricopeptide repeat protein [Actinomycetota bacterium]|nr:tetratricopeptide repeat protein [Actinomycetota bacterium]